jgi:hypothetical protein
MHLAQNYQVVGFHRETMTDETPVNCRMTRTPFQHPQLRIIQRYPGLRISWGLPVIPRITQKIPGFPSYSQLA